MLLSKQFPEGRWFWPLQIAGWFLFAVAAMVPALMLLHGPDDAILFVAVRMLIGIGLTAALRPAYRWIRHRGGSWWWRTAVVLGCCVICICVDYWLAEIALTRYLLAMGTLGKLTYYPRAASFLIWTTLYFAICHWRASRSEQWRLLQLESENRQAELQLLRSQINPHFLLNALNSILAEKHNPDQVETITQALATHLHYSLRQNGELVPLGTELKALHNFLAVERVRFEGRFEFEIVADAAVRQEAMPAALIQPLVENAIKYGQMTSPNPLRVRIAAVLGPETVSVEVSNTGKWVGNPDQRGTGIGLSNLKRRLHLVFGDQAQLEHEVKHGSVCGRLRLPRATARKAQA